MRVRVRCVLGVWHAAAVVIEPLNSDISSINVASSFGNSSMTNSFSSNTNNSSTITTSSVYTWGDNGSGALGHGDEVHR